jgi:hypothetical protein
VLTGGEICCHCPIENREEERKERHSHCHRKGCGTMLRQTWTLPMMLEPRVEIIEIVLHAVEPPPGDGPVVHLKHVPAYVLVKLTHTRAKRLSGFRGCIIPVEVASSSSVTGKSIERTIPNDCLHFHGVSVLSPTLLLILPCHLREASIYSTFTSRCREVQAGRRFGCFEILMTRPF